MNTAAYTTLKLLSEIAKRHGTQCVVASIDVRSDGLGEGWQCYSHAGKHAGASAVAAASIFHFTEQTPVGAKAAMQAAGIPVRQNFINNV